MLKNKYSQKKQKYRYYEIIFLPIIKRFLAKNIESFKTIYYFYQDIIKDSQVLYFCSNFINILIE